MSDYILAPDGATDELTKIGLMGHDSGDVSDGWHTFNELYHYRMLYNAGMASALVSMTPIKRLKQNIKVVKSWRHNDGELCFGKDNYFVVVMQLPTGQVSNHYHGDHWDLFKVPEVERAPEYDGHTPQESAERLEKYLRGNS
jgi:hypothetical protein